MCGILSVALFHRMSLVKSYSSVRPSIVVSWDDSGLDFSPSVDDCSRMSSISTSHLCSCDPSCRLSATLPESSSSFVFRLPPWDNIRRRRPSIRVPSSSICSRWDGVSMLSSCSLASPSSSSASSSLTSPQLRMPRKSARSAFCDLQRIVARADESAGTYRASRSAFRSSAAVKRRPGLLF